MKISAQRLLEKGRETAVSMTPGERRRALLRPLAQVFLRGDGGQGIAQLCEYSAQSRYFVRTFSFRQSGGGRGYRRNELMGMDTNHLRNRLCIR